MFHTPRFARTAGAPGVAGEPGDPVAIIITHVSRVANQSVTSGTGPDFSFDTEVFDDANAWAIGTPTKIITPSGYTKVRMSAGVRWATNSTNNRALFIRKNTVDLQLAAYKAFSTSDMATLSPWIATVAGDEFTAGCFQDSGSTLDMTGWMQAEWAV